MLGREFAEMFKNGVIMDVVTPEQAIIAEKSGAIAVMALERVPADIRKQGGVSRMSDPAMIIKIMAAVSIPVMAKVRLGHVAEARILQEIGVDFIDESEVLTPANQSSHINKSKFKIPFVCGACNLGEAVRRIQEGASMIRTKGEAGTGDISQAVRHAQTISDEIKALQKMTITEMTEYAERERIEDFSILEKIVELGRLPVVNFAAGGIATPADAALMMHEFKMDGVFVGSGIFKSETPALMAVAVVKATTHHDDAKILLEVSTGLGAAMVGISDDEIPLHEKYAKRGW